MTLKPEKFFYAAITFKLTESPYTSTTRYFGTNHYGPREILSASGVTTFGIIRDLAGLGSEVGEVLPKQRTGSITLDNTRGSTAHNKRFTDWLHKETIIEQQIQIVSVEKPINAVATFPDDFFTEFTGIIKRVRVQNDRNRVVLDIRSKEISKEIFPFMLDENEPTFIGVPEKNRGKYLPLIFGRREVPAVLMDSDTVNQEVFTYATHLTADYTVGGVSEYYIKDYDGEYRRCDSVAAYNTVVLDTRTTLGAITPPVIDTEHARSISGYTHGSTNYLLRGMLFRFDGTGNGSAPVDGTIQVAVYEVETTMPIRKIGQASVLKSTYTSQIRGSAEFDVEFVFTDFVFLSQDKEYAVSVRFDGSATAAQNPNPGENTGLATVNYWLKTSTLRESSNDWSSATADYPWTIAFYGVEFADTTTGDNYAKFTATQRAGANNPDLTTLDIIVDVAGLTDDSSGTLTGTANKALETSLDAARLLYDQMGLTLDDSTYSPQTILETTYPRNIDATTRGRMTTEAFLAEILRQSACKIFEKRDGSHVFWPYGYKVSSTDIKYVSETDATLLDWEIKGTETIVNKIQMLYDERAKPLNLEEIIAGAAKNYASNLNWYNGSALENANDIDAWTTGSVTVYGEQQLNDTFLLCNQIAEDEAAQFLAKYYLTVFAYPHIYMRIRVPYWFKNYKTVDHMDVIYFEHNDNPSNSGSSFDGLPDFPVYNGEQNPNITNGRPWRQAQGFHARIMGRKVNWNVGSSNEPTIEFNIRLLSNPWEIW